MGVPCVQGSNPSSGTRCRAKCGPFGGRFWLGCAQSVPMRSPLDSWGLRRRLGLRLFVGETTTEAFRMDTTTTLGRRCASDGLPVALLEYLSEQAEIARRTFTNGGGVHIEAIESFPNWHTTHNDLDDPRLWALWTLQG